MDLKEAAKTAVGLAQRLTPEKVELGRAMGRILASDFAADRDVPGEARSKWDGYAVSSRDLASASRAEPTVLDIIPGEITAGKRASFPSGARKCFRIMTGAALPAGMDAVIPFEDGVASGNDLVFNEPVSSGRGVIFPGSDTGEGEILLKEGDILSPTRIALIAALGRNHVEVYRRPRIAVLATGDELRETYSASPDPVVFCNNIHLLSNLIRAGGGEPVFLEIAPDDPDVIFSRLEKAEAELVITTGGMGKGSRDFVLAVWKRLGIKVHFDRLNVSPGKGSALGTGDDRIFLGLPGNPWAGQVIYEEIAAPIIRSFSGIRTDADFTFEAMNAAEMTKKKGSYRAFHGNLKIRGGVPTFTPNKGETQPGLSSFRAGYAYTLLDAEETFATEGQRIKVKLPDLPLIAWALLNP
jgi:molybdenum cofactor synthesis domain-containing protein